MTKLTFDEKRILILGLVEIAGLILAVGCGLLIVEIVRAIP